MKFVFPIADKTADELYKINRSGFGGFFPIGAFNTWHGGMHFDGNHKVVAIADGVIIAYRFTKTYIVENAKNNSYQYSNCFMLLQHEYISPKGASLKFYSHYMHLCPWSELTDTQRKSVASFFTKDVIKVKNAKGLNVRSSMDASTQANYLRTLKNDTIVEYAIVDENWARLTGDTEEYIHYNGKVANAIVPVDPELDKLVLCNIPVKANDVLGYSGLNEDSETPKNYSTVHIELFSSDSIEPFILNHLNDGKNKPILFKIPAGTSLKEKQKKYVQEKIKYNGKIAKNTTVKILDASGTDYCKLQEYELIRVIPKEYVSGYDKNSKKYKVLTAETLPELSKLFDMYSFTKTDTLKFVGYADDSGQKVENDTKNPPLKRIVSFHVPSENAETYWAKKSVISKIEKGLFTTENEITDLYNANPDTVSFEKDVCKTTEDLLVKIEGCETCKDENGILWYKIKDDTGSGWICDTDSTIKKLSAADWPGFTIVKEESGDTQFDPLIDINNLSPFFKSIVDKINTDSSNSFFSFFLPKSADKKKAGSDIVTKKEMQNALNDPKMSVKLQRLICYSPSEWWTDTSFSQYERVLKLLGEASAELLKQRLKNLCWWDEVATKVEGFPLSPSVYHFNPVAFIENMKAMDVPFLYPLRFRVDSYVKGKMGEFGHGRNNNRVHAGCDLYAPIGTEILAVKDGIVRQELTYFYEGTYELQIDHGDFIARYGEVQNKKAPGISNGAFVKQGQVVGYVGDLQSLNMSMLHLELYAGTESGPLTVVGNKISNIKYERRDDLLDPTPFLDSGELIQE
jgi:hypothetical protein